MAKLAKVKRKINPLAMVDRNLYDQLQPMGAQVEMADKLKKENEAELKALEADPSKDVMPIADEYELARARRRRNARMRSGRAQTTLAQDEGFGG